MQTGQVLYSRYQDGARPVRVLERGYEVYGDAGKPKKFETARGLLAELTGHPTGRHWTLARYFNIEEKQAPAAAPLFDLFAPESPAPQVKPTTPILTPLAPKLITLLSSIEVTVPTPRKATKTGVVVTGAVGIDLVGRGHEVRRLFYKCFGKRVMAGGHDPDDVLQEVYKGLLARNRGICPWDPSKSSFGHYVYMVIGCVFSNYKRKTRRIREHEQVGIMSFDDGSAQVVDVSQAGHLAAPTTFEHTSSERAEVADDLESFMWGLEDERPDQVRLAISIMPDVTAGWSRKDIALKHGTSMPALSRAISLLRRSSKTWFEQMRRVE